MTNTKTKNSIIIDYTEDTWEDYEKLLEENERLRNENIDLRSGIYLQKTSLPCGDKSLQELMDMPTYGDLKKEVSFLNAYINHLEKLVYRLYVGEEPTTMNMANIARIVEKYGGKNE